MAVAQASSVYLAFCNSTCARTAVGVRQLWCSLPVASKLLVSVVVAEACLWVANLAYSLRLAEGCSYGSCDLEVRQVTITTTVVQLLNAYLTLNAVYEENPFQLLAGVGFSILTGLLWLIYAAALQLQSQTWRLGLSLGFVAGTTINIWLAYLTHQQFGWRVHSRIPCDFRRKHVAEKRHLYIAVNRMRTLLRLTCFTVIINAVNGLVLALGKDPAAGGAAGGSSAPLVNSPTSPAVSGLLATVGLYSLPLTWLVVTYLAVRRNSSKLELLSTITMSMLVLLPAFPLYWVFSPLFMWPGRIAVQLLLIAVPLAAWLVLHVATWCSMRQVLRLFRSPTILQLLADAAEDDMGLQQEVPEQLQPLLKGAWLLKTPSTPGGKAAAKGTSSFNGGSKPNAKDLFAVNAQHPVGSSRSWIIPTFTSFNGGSASNGSRSRLQAHDGSSSSVWQRLWAFLCGSNKHWRFFQLSSDLTTLRWAWDKYVLLYYVDSLTVDVNRLTITLHMALDPDLTLAFKDQRLFDQWDSALQLLLHMLTGAAPGSIQAGMYPSTAEAEAIAAVQPAITHPKAHITGLLEANSCGSGSGQSAALTCSHSLDQSHLAVGSPPSSPSPLSQHSLVMSALHVQHGLKAACNGGTDSRIHNGSPADDDAIAIAASSRASIKHKTSLNSFLRASRRHSVKDPNALKLRQAQAVVEVVTRQLSKSPSQLAAADGSSTGTPEGFRQLHHKLQQQQQHIAQPRTVQYMQQEHRAWLQQDMQSSQTSSLRSTPAAGRSLTPAAAAVATAGVEQTGIAADALACQLHLPPHQVLNHLQQQQGTVAEHWAAGGEEGMVDRQAARTLPISQQATGVDSNGPHAMHMGPFKTPPGLLKQMHLSSEHQHQSSTWRQLSSSSEDGSSAPGAAWQGMKGATSSITSSSNSGYTGTNETSAGQQLQGQGTYSLGHQSSYGLHQASAAAVKHSNPSRLQQQSPGQFYMAQQQPSQQYRQQGSESKQLQGTPPQSPGLQGSRCIDQGSSPEAGLAPRVAQVMQTSVASQRPSTMPSAAAGDRAHQQHSSLRDDRTEEGWGQQQQQQQPLMQYFEQQYSQPPTPNIYGVYTSAALARREASPVVFSDAAANSSTLMRAHSMPADLKRQAINRPAEAAYMHPLQHAEPIPLPCSLIGTASAAGTHVICSGFMGGLRQPLEHHKQAALGLGGCFMPPVPDDFVSNSSVIPAVWNYEPQEAVATLGDIQLAQAAAATPVRFAPVNQQSAGAGQFMCQLMAAGCSDSQSTKTTTGGSVLHLDSSTSRSRTSSEAPAALYHTPARHLRMSYASGVTSSSITAAPALDDDRSLHGTSPHTMQHSHSIHIPLEHLTQSLAAGSHHTAAGPAGISPLKACDSTQGTAGSGSTSRAISPLPAGLPPFSAVMAQVEGSMWADEVAVVVSGSVPKPWRAYGSPASDAVQAPPGATQARAPISRAAAADEDRQHSTGAKKNRDSSSGGGWRSSLQRLLASLRCAVSGGGGGSARSTSSQGSGQAAAVADGPLAQPAAASGMDTLSPLSSYATAAAAAGPGLRPPSRTPSLSAARRERPTVDRIGSFSATGQCSFARKGSFADSTRASNTDGLLTRGASRTSIGNVTVYGWSEWGRSTLTDFDSLIDIESLVIPSDDGGPLDVQVGEADIPAAKADLGPDWAAARASDEGVDSLSIAINHAGFAAFRAALAAVDASRVASPAEIEGSSSGCSSRRSSDSGDMQRSLMQVNPAQAVIEPPVVSSSSAAKYHSSSQSDPVQHRLVKQQSTQHPDVATTVSADSAGSMTQSSSCSAGGGSYGTSQPGLGLVSSVLYGNTPLHLLPVLQEAPSSAELDSAELTPSLPEQQQQGESATVHRQCSSSKGHDELLSAAAVPAVAATLPQQQHRNLDEQDHGSLHSFTFDASVQHEQEQPITLQAAYMLAKCRAAGDVAEGAPQSAGTGMQQQQQQQQQYALGSPRSPHSPRNTFRQTSWLGRDAGSSPRAGAARPAVLRVSVSDVTASPVSGRYPEAEHAGAPAANRAVRPQSPSMASFASLDSPQALSRLQVKVPAGRRSSVPGQGGSVSHQGNLGIAQHYQQQQQLLIADQLPHHDDGYAVNSPSSLMSYNSHTSMFTDTSPRTARTWRQSMASAGYGGSAQLANSLSMTYSGWSAYSGASNRHHLASGLGKGMRPQVSVELVEWHSLQLGRKIGHGAEGCVYEARYQDAPVAVKEAPDMNEIEMYLAAGVHDNIVGLRGLCQKDDGTWCLLLEYCGRGTLDTLLHHSRSPLPRAAHHLQHRAGDHRRSSSSGSKAALAPPGAPADQQQCRQDLVKLLPFMRSIARGLLHLHSRRPAILHRDIKPANIFIGHGMVMKIGDFGMSRHVHPPAADAFGSSAEVHHRRSSVAGGSRIIGARGSVGGVRNGSGDGASAEGAQHGVQHSAGSAAGVPNRTLTPGIVGTICYSAPEVLDEQLQTPNASVEHIVKADVYSLGVTFWEMVERRRPFEGMDGMQICALWIADPARMALPPLTVGEDASECDRRVLAALQELLRECTAFDPDKRPAMSQVLAKIKYIQRMCDPKVIAAEAARISKTLARTEAPTGAGLDTAVLSAAGIYTDSMQQQQQYHAVDAAPGAWVPWGGHAASGHPQAAPGVTDPAVAAAIDAAAVCTTATGPGSPAAESIRHAGSLSSSWPEDTIARPLGEGVHLHPAGGANRYRRSRSDKGMVLSNRVGSSVPPSHALLHSRSLPYGQITILPDVQHKFLEADRRVSGAGLHHRFSR